MNKRQSWATVGVVLLCGGILVLFTDIEVGMVRWVNCGPLATEGEQQSEVCRGISPISSMQQPEVSQRDG